MRDKLIHDYFGVDLEAVWLTSVRDIVELEKSKRNIKLGLNRLSKSRGGRI